MTWSEQYFQARRTYVLTYVRTSSQLGVIQISGPAVCAAAGSKGRTCLDFSIASPVMSGGSPVLCNATPALSSAPPVLNATPVPSTAPQVLCNATAVLCSATPICLVHRHSSAIQRQSCIMHRKSSPVQRQSSAKEFVFFGFPQPQKLSDLNPSKSSANN